MSAGPTDTVTASIFHSTPTRLTRSSTTSSVIASQPKQTPSPNMSTTTDAQPQTSLFAIPAPLRSLFKLFPLVTYPPSALPIRSPSSTSASKPRLYIFANASSELSYNPSCLKHQTLLRMAGVDVELVASNNHASPSGALPFILTEGGRPVAAERIGGFVREESGRDLRKGEERRVEAYRALISQAIRPAWVCPFQQQIKVSPLTKTSYTPSTSTQATTTSSAISTSPTTPSSASQPTRPSRTPPQPRSSKPQTRQQYSPRTSSPNSAPPLKRYQHY